MLNVRIGAMPGRINDYALERGTTAGQALEIAELSSEGYQIKINSGEATKDTVLNDGDLVLLVKQIKGN